MFVVVIIQPSNNWLKLSFFIMIKYLKSQTKSNSFQEIKTG